MCATMGLYMGKVTGQTIKGASYWRDDASIVPYKLFAAFAATGKGFSTAG